MACNAEIFVSCLQNPIPSNKPGVEPKRPPRPNNITPLLKLSPTVGNSVHITWAHDYTRNFVVGIYLVKKLTSTDLLNRLKNKGIRPAEYSRGLSMNNKNYNLKPANWFCELQSKKSCRRMRTVKLPRLLCVFH